MGPIRSTRSLSRLCNFHLAGAGVQSASAIPTRRLAWIPRSNDESLHQVKIAFLGNFRPPHSTENDLAWSYERLGHVVVRLQENEARADQVLKASRDSDLFHWVHTHGWDRLRMPMVLQQLKRLGVPTISSHLDTWFGLRREEDVGRHPFWQTDYVFTADGGAHNWLRSFGINHHYLPAGVVERDAHLGEVVDHYRHDVVFTGSRKYHPEWPYRSRLLDWLCETYGSGFAHYGHGGRPGVRGNDLNNLYTSAKIVVGDTLCLNFNHQEYWSDRIYETTGRGGFIIHPYIHGLETQFRDGEEAAFYTYGNFDQLRQLIDYYLSSSDEREQTRLAGHARTKVQHTYTHRVQQIIGVVGP